MAEYYEDQMSNALNSQYHPRLTAPESGNPYYNTKANGGYSSAILGNYPKGSDSSTRRGSSSPALNVLRNCVGYAYGRFNEIGNWGYMKYLSPVNAGKFMDYKGSCQSGLVPKLGSCMVWKDSDGPGHVAIVEEIHSDGSITTSESEWNGSTFTTYKRSRGSDGNWIQGCNWMVKRIPRYKFLGFIYNPAVPDNASPSTPYADANWGYTGTTISNAVTLENAKESLSNLFGNSVKSSDTITKVVYEEVTKDVEVTKARTVEYDGVLNQTKSASLLTYPTNVESPFILLTVGEYTFGTYSAVSDGSKLYVHYPNFIKSMEVTKINGQLNQYTIQLVYQIQAGNDPNLIDKIFGAVGYGTVKISYGDWNAPTFIYKEEEAIITKLNSNVDFASAKIIYTLSCTSTALGLVASAHSFEATKAKPSDLIKKLLFTPKYGLTSVFTGMKTRTQVEKNGWIASNDKVVQIEARENIDPLSYINYLVTCMVCESNAEDSILLDSSYYLTLYDDVYGEQGGPYFTIRQIYSSSKTISNQDMYEVDIGYPSDAMVISFNIRDDNSWSLLYNYSDSIQREDYVYNIDNKGRVVTEYSPAYSTSSRNFVTTPSQKTWWTQMTKFPISATLEVKGLVRPAMLMSYVKVNAFFFGQRHVSSGIYFVTKQVDKVNGDGYRTVLYLTRFAGDEDYIRKETEQVTYKVSKVVTTKVDKDGKPVKTITGYQSQETLEAVKDLILWMKMD